MGGEIRLYVRVSTRQWDMAGVHIRNWQESVDCRLSTHYEGLRKACGHLNATGGRRLVTLVIKILDVIHRKSSLDSSPLKEGDFH